MRSFLAVLGRELRAYFYSPMAWIILTFFLLINGFVFGLILSFLTDPQAVTGATPFEYFFSSLFFWFVVIFVTPVVTMRLISEERRSGTIESLMTAPISENQVVAAKFVAAFGFYSFLWLPTLAYPLLIWRHAEVDWGPIWAGYLGVLGIGAMFLSVGMFGSSFTKNQIVAAVTTFGILIFMLFGPWAESLIRNDSVVAVLEYINLPNHMEEFSKGIIDSRRLVYYLSTTLFFLFLTSRALEAKKWR